VGPWESLYRNARLATMVRQTSHRSSQAYGAVHDGVIAVAGGRIAWIGQEKDLPEGWSAGQTIDLHGRWVTPGLIDCHTHLVYGGNRSAEFEMRLNGASYEEIARAGGGILSTVNATREAEDEELLAHAMIRLGTLASEGVTTVEIKSGYGLDKKTELTMLRVARGLSQTVPITIRTTFLGAHAVPPEYKDNPDAYIALMVDDVLPEAYRAGLVDAVDAFCESIAFTPAQTRRMFDAAKALGLPVKLHADQLSDTDGAALAAEYGALSAEHLEYTNEQGIAAMAAAGTVAVLLPGAFYTLRETKLPPIDGFRKAGVPIAIATDSNPGSAPVTSLLLMLNMACTLFRLTPEEALAGVTRNAAQALGLQDTHGTLEVGKVADLAIWDIERPAELCYRIGFNPLAGLVREGLPLRKLKPKVEFY